MQNLWSALKKVIYCQSVCLLVDWFIGQSVAQSVSLLVGWLVGQSVGWLIGWLVDCLVVWLYGRLVCQSACWSVVWLVICWLVGESVSQCLHFDSWWVNLLVFLFVNLPACLPVFLHVPKLPRKDNSYAPRGVQNDCNSGLEKAFTIMHNQLMSTSTIKLPITNWVRKIVAVKAGACHKKQNFQAKQKFYQLQLIPWR